MKYKFGSKIINIKNIKINDQVFVQLCEIDNEKLTTLAEVQIDTNRESANFISHSRQLPYAAIKILFAHTDAEIKKVNLVIKVSEIIEVSKINDNG